MPYTKPSEAPDYVPKEKKKQWIAVFNSAWDKAKADGKSDKEAESSAFAQANGVAGPNSKKAAQGTIMEPSHGDATKGVRYLVPEGKHLPYTGADGKPDHRLMGAAWAALHGGYRGNKYEGPGRESAIAKLRSIYRSVGMTPPGDKSSEEKFAEVGMGSKELFAQIFKVSDIDQTVSGFLVAEQPDMMDEIWDYDSSKGYFRAWNTKFAEKTDGESVGNLRSMHTKIAAGKFTSMDYDDESKRIFVTAKVVDLDEWEKVREGVYTGFSIGAKYVRKWRDGKYTRWTGDPYEGSLVDNPAIPDCSFVHKFADGTEQVQHFATRKTESEESAQKGMGRISHLAQTLDGLNSALEMADYDHQATGTHSSALERLHTHAKHLHDAFAAYTQEQVDEHKKQHSKKTLSEEDDEMKNKELREKFVRLQTEVGDILKAMDHKEPDEDDKPDHSAADCKDAECKYHGKSKGVSGSGGPDESAHGAPSVGGPREIESSNAHWSGKMAGVETALKGYDARLDQIEELARETANLVMKIGDQLKPTNVNKNATVSKAADNEVTDAQKAAVKEIEKLKETDPTAAATLAIKMAQENPRFLIGGSRLLPAPASSGSGR